jgi:hypothetical protein
VPQPAYELLNSTYGAAQRASAAAGQALGALMPLRSALAAAPGRGTSRQS